jgi:hypothetical protein
MLINYLSWNLTLLLTQNNSHYVFSRQLQAPLQIILRCAIQFYEPCCATAAVRAIHTEEQRRVIRDEIVKIYEPLVDAYRMMHRLVCQLWIPETAGSGDAFIGFTKDSSLSLIPTKVLEQKGLGSYLLSRPHRSAQRYIKGH